MSIGLGEGSEAISLMEVSVNLRVTAVKKRKKVEILFSLLLFQSSCLGKKIRQQRRRRQRPQQRCIYNFRRQRSQ